METSPRQRFLAYVRDPQGQRPIVSPFLPADDVIRATLVHLGLEVGEDRVENETRLARALDYEPMFMTGCTEFIFPWRRDEERSDEIAEVHVIDTPAGPWEKRVSRGVSPWADEAEFPVRTREDHEKLQLVCQQVETHEAEIRAVYREWRQRVGEGGVIVIGHPNPAWLAMQIGRANIILHWFDLNDAFRRSMDAIFQASLFIFGIAMEEGIDFMSASGLGLEMISPALFREMDLPILQAYADWVHQRGGLFWYHNCGLIHELVNQGLFDQTRADVIETLAPPPTGDIDLQEDRRLFGPAICTKGNLDLGLLRDGTPEEVAIATREMVRAVRGFPHIHSTSDAVFVGTPPENLIAHVRTARETAEVL